MNNITFERKTAVGQLNRLVHVKIISEWNNLTQYFKGDSEIIFDKACQNSGERKGNLNVKGRLICVKI